MPVPPVLKHSVAVVVLAEAIEAQLDRQGFGHERPRTVNCGESSCHHLLLAQR